MHHETYADKAERLFDSVLRMDFSNPVDADLNSLLYRFVFNKRHPQIGFEHILKKSTFTSGYMLPYIHYHSLDFQFSVVDSPNWPGLFTYFPQAKCSTFLITQDNQITHQVPGLNMDHSLALSLVQLCRERLS